MGKGTVRPLNIRKLMIKMAIFFNHYAKAWEFYKMETKSVLSISYLVERLDVKCTYKIMWHFKSMLSPDKQGLEPERKYLYGHYQTVTAEECDV